MIALLAKLLCNRARLTSKDQMRNCPQSDSATDQSRTQGGGSELRRVIFMETVPNIQVFLFPYSLKRLYCIYMYRTLLPYTARQRKHFHLANEFINSSQLVNGCGLHGIIFTNNYRYLLHSIFKHKIFS